LLEHKSSSSLKRKRFARLTYYLNIHNEVCVNTSLAVRVLKNWCRDATKSD